MDLYAFEFELEDFGQNISHLTQKTYYTHNFFTDRQVYASITRDFEMTDTYQFKSVPCTLAIPINVTKIRQWFSSRNVNYKKGDDAANICITEGYQEYLCPQSKFLAFSFIKPPPILFIGKKGALARISSLQKVDYQLQTNKWTTLDLIYFQDYLNAKQKEILKFRIIDASQRFLVGEFKCAKVLTVTFKGQEYRFFSLVNKLSTFQ